MTNRVKLALEALSQLRKGGTALPAQARGQLERIERTLRGETAGGRAAPAAARPPDAYAQLLGTPADLERDLNSGSGGPVGGAPVNGGGSAPSGGNASTAPPPAPPPPPSTSQIGQRAADALDAIDFPGFVAALVTGTFKAIVDASKQQISEYAKLVASLSQTVEDFSRDNVTPNQVRDWLHNRHPQDLQVALPAPGKEKEEQPRLVPRPEHEGETPPWLDDYGLGGQQLTAELTDGPLVDAGRAKVGEERMQTLATLVLMGINRVVVSDGDIRARLMFHASARDTTRADVEQQQLGVAMQQVQASQATSMMVSTVKVNAQADASIKADLMGEVHITFKSETFPLERFADSAAIQLINRHARWQKEGAAPTTPATAATATAGAPTASAAPRPTPAGGGA